MRAFVIAMEKEAEPLRPRLRPDDRLYVSGVGKVNAAAATMRAICDGATEIWNIGLAGGFDPSMEIGDLYEISEAVEYDFDLAEINGTRVGQLDERDSPYLPLAPLNRFPKRRLASGDRFGAGERELALFRALGTTVRDMEGAAIAHVCEKASIPCHAVKCISDVIGKGRLIDQYAEHLSFCLSRLGLPLDESAG